MYFFFFFNDTATTEIYTLSLHDALPIYLILQHNLRPIFCCGESLEQREKGIHIDFVNQQLTESLDRKSTRLNSSHANISYAVFCLKKKKCLVRARISSIFAQLRL